jgi:UDP-glucose 6-dehydrogenase
MKITVMGAGYVGLVSGACLAEMGNDVEVAVRFGTIQFIAVGTPPDEDGAADLQCVLAAAGNIGRHMTDYKVVVDKSTAPVGTADAVRDTIERCQAERGASLSAYDPVAMPDAKRRLSDLQGLEYAESPMAAVQGADALLVVTEWKEFRSPDFHRLRGALRQPVVFDGRNIFPAELVRSAGLEYHAIGRGAAAMRNAA